MNIQAKENKIINLSIGRPRGLMSLNISEALTKIISFSYKNINQEVFAKEFVQAHLGHLDLTNNKDIRFLATRGIGVMLGLVPLAHKTSNKNAVVATMTKPGYPPPAAWCKHLGLQNYALTTNTENNFRFNPSDIEPKTSLIMMNYPHNSSGQIAVKKWLEEICSYCEQKGITLFNDAVYSKLSYSRQSVTLSEVAVNFPKLNWAEAFSISKVIGEAGWKIGAMVGSNDLVSDIKKVCESTWLGPLAFAQNTVLKLIKDEKLVQEVKDKFSTRLDILIDILVGAGMRLAVEPESGFFALFKTPTKAFGQRITDAKHFNYLMLENTGIAGAPLSSYIRYSVLTPIENYREQIEQAFRGAEISYNSKGS